MARRFAIDQHGCAKNQVDAELMIASLEAEGWEYAEEADGADLVIVNSCGFIEEAKEESLNALLALRAAHPDKKILLSGCLAERYATELAADLPEADGFFGNGDPTRAAVAVRALFPPAGKAVERPVVKFPQEGTPGGGSRTRLLSRPGTAYLKITEGCGNNCSYCAIPLIRGPLRSRPVAEVRAEFESLLSRGVKEVILIGQDLGSYGVDAGPPALVPLLRELLAVGGKFWLRVLYIHPDHFPEGLLELMRADGRLLPYLDVPFQHAAKGVLSRMGRRGDAAAYLALVERVRSALPESAIRSTFLLGFPGETEADFLELRSFQDEARLDWLGAFSYSREEGTAAWGFKGRVPAKLAASRKAAVEEAQAAIMAERLERFVGKSFDVLVEEPVAGEDLAIGRAWFQAPDVDGLVVVHASGAEAGDMLRCRVAALRGVDLEAVLDE